MFDPPDTAGLAYGAGVARRMRFAVVATLLLGAAACSSIEPGQSSSTFTTLTRPERDPSPTTSTVPAAETDLGDVAGLIAATDRLGLTIHRPDGEVVAEFAEDQVVRQPTWSRSGDSLIATLIDPGTGISSVAVIDPETWTLETTPAARSYFFYSWNHAGDRIAALGPGRVGGTAVDFIDENGLAAADSTVSGVSMFVAWEPGGADLLLHANERLLLIDDFAALEESSELGDPGIRFQAPSWVAGERAVVFAQAVGSSTTLLRLDVDTGEQVLLGDLEGFAAISVHPDGNLAAITHGAFSDPPATTPDTVQVAYQPPSRVVELIDLTTGSRTSILDEIGLWLEWDPTGDRLLVATQEQDQLVWHVWDGAEIRELFRGRPTQMFLQQYLPFADQFVESPRLWSPDGAAFVVTAEVGGQGEAIAVEASTGASSTVGRADVAFWGSSG